MGIQPGARFPALSTNALPATLYGHFTQAMYRNRLFPAILAGPTDTKVVNMTAFIAT
jgi:hypothetical protein